MSNRPFSFEGLSVSTSMDRPHLAHLRLIDNIVFLNLIAMERYFLLKRILCELFARENSVDKSFLWDIMCYDPDCITHKAFFVR